MLITLFPEAAPCGCVFVSENDVVCAPTSSLTVYMETDACIKHTTKHENTQPQEHGLMSNERNEDKERKMNRCGFIK